MVERMAAEAAAVVSQYCVELEEVVELADQICLVYQIDLYLG